MKRRIIAALTALVMVVTMIPASAFAATSAPADEVVAIMTQVFKNSEDTSKKKVRFEDRALINQAYAAYGKVEDKTDLVVESVNYGEKVLDAVSAFGNFDRAVSDFVKAINKVVDGTVVYHDRGTATWTQLVDAKKAFDVVFADAGVQGVAKDIAVVAPKKDEDRYKMLSDNGAEGQKDYTMMKSLIADSFPEAGVALNAFTAVNSLAGITDAEIAKIKDHAMTGWGSKSLYTAAKNAIDATENKGADYAFLAKGYTQYFKITERLAALDTSDEADFFAALNGSDSVEDTAKSVKSVAEIDAMNTTERTAFVKLLGDVKAYIEKNTAASKDIKLVYAAAKKNYDRWGTKDAVNTVLKNFPSADAVAGMDSVTLVKYYNEYKAIDKGVAEITSMKTKYKDLGDAFNARFNDFKPEAIAEAYAAKVVEAIKAIGDRPTRADVAKLDNVIALIVEYDAISTADDFSTKITEADKLSERDVYSLKEDASVVDTDIENSLLEKEINKIEKDAFKTFVAKVNYVKEIAKADVETLEALATEVSTKGTGAIPTGIDNDAEKAKAALKAYNTKYAALSDLLKSDLAKLKKGTNQLYAKIDENIEAIAKIAAEQPDDQDAIRARLLAGRMAALTTYVNINKTNIETGSLASNKYYKEAKAELDSIEAVLASDAMVKAIFEADASEHKPTYDAYKDTRTYLLSLTGSTSAATAVVKAIADLKVIDTEKDTVTKSLVDSTIAAYESVKAMYDALADADKAYVTNYNRMNDVKDGIKAGLVELFKAEVAKIGIISSGIPMLDSQKATVNGITSMIESYNKYAAKSDYEGTDEWSKYETAVEKMKTEADDAAEKEFKEVEKTLIDVKAKYMTSTGYVVSKASAVALIDAADKYNALSDEAKAWGDKVPTNAQTTYKIPALLAAANEAKTIVLNYATVEVADVEFDGSAAEPTVIVKDVKGNVIAATEYDVVYTNNTKPGTATVTVKAKATGNYVGEISKNFQVIAKELAKVENVKFDTDYGIVRVIFDRTADIEGIDVRYQVQYKKTTSDKWITKYPTKGYEYLTLRNLTKNGKYDVRVRAYTDDFGTERVYGEYSDVKEVYANRNGAKSGIMYKAVIKSLSTKSSSVTMTVNPVKYQTIPQGVTWTFSCKKYGSQYTTWTTKTTKSTTATFKNLKKGTKYVVRAQYSYTSAVDGKTTVKSNFSTYKYIVVK